MKFLACVCILFYLVATGSAFPRPGRPHPLWSTQQAYQPQDDFLTMALLMGFDFNELLTLQAASGRGINNLGFGNLANMAAMIQLLGNGGGVGTGLGSLAQQRARQDMNTLSLLGILDGPDVPDGPAGGRRRGGRRRGGPPKAAGAKPAAGAGGEGGAGGEAEGAAPAAKPAKATKAAAKPKRRGPRRQGPARG